MEEQKTNAGQGLGIAGLVLGIIALIIAFIPCIGVLAVIPGAVAIVLSVVGLSQARKANGQTGLIIAAMVVSILGTAIALAWWLFFAGAAGTGGKIMKEIGKEIRQEMETEFGEEWEQEFDEMGKELEETLEDLEAEDKDWEEFEWGEEVTDEKVDMVLDAYEDLIKDYVILVDKAQEGDLSALSEYIEVSVKAVTVATKISAIAPKLNEEQKERFRELEKKYEKALEEAEDIQ